MNIINKIYNQTIRPYLPNTVGLLNGVATPFPKYLDRDIVHQDYEEGLIDGIQSLVAPGDRVVIIGGGRGVSAVRTAEVVGPTGSVTVFEAVEEQVDKIQQVAEMNKVADRIDVNQGTFGDQVHSTIFDLEPGTFTSVDSLPKCDCLIMDCEGCERYVLEELDTPPQKMLVETHGKFESPTEENRKMMEEMGYEITYEVTEFEEGDVCILGGQQ